jgi:hypothetical protein
MVSVLKADLGEWTPGHATQWAAPVTYRDWVRKRYYALGQRYPIRDEPLAMGPHTLRPLQPEDPPPKWWLSDAAV